MSVSGHEFNAHALSTIVCLPTMFLSWYHVRFCSRKAPVLDSQPELIKIGIGGRARKRPRRPVSDTTGINHMLLDE